MVVTRADNANGELLKESEELQTSSLSIVMSFGMHADLSESEKRKLANKVCLFYLLTSFCTVENSDVAVQIFLALGSQVYFKT